VCVYIHIYTHTHIYIHMYMYIKLLWVIKPSKLRTKMHVDITTVIISLLHQTLLSL